MRDNLHKKYLGHDVNLLQVHGKSRVDTWKVVFEDLFTPYEHCRFTVSCCRARRLRWANAAWQLVERLGILHDESKKCECIVLDMRLVEYSRQELVIGRAWVLLQARRIQGISFNDP